MATSTHTPQRRLRVAASAAGLLLAGLHPVSSTPPFGTQGTVARVKPSARPAVEAAFPRESYRPGERARLVVFGRSAAPTTVQVLRAGTEHTRIGARDLMLGTPVGSRLRLPAGARELRIPLGDWPSGLYFARLRSENRVGYAPFVLRPRTLGAHPVAVVLPTLTWQAYNFRDDDHDGDEDSWYAQGTSVRLGRPFENRGVPPHYKFYDQPFLRWAQETGHEADYLAQADLERTSGADLARRYSLLVFPGHHEYVTGREYDAVEAYRDRGGNLAFLSANNFFYRVDRRGSRLRRVAKWRDLGRPEARLIGVQYIGNDFGEHRGAWIVRSAGADHWLFDGTGVREGSAFSNGGIEIDKVAPSSPRGTRILAEIPNLLGRGMSGQMSYYETARGAKVFAAGAFTLAGAIRQRPVAQLVGNLWERLAAERVAQARSLSAATAPERTIDLPILMYHRINVVRPTTPAESRGLTVHPTVFARQMRWLAQHGYHTVTQRDLYEALFEGRALGPRAILITFDDGYRDVLYKASPALERHGFKATAYVISGRISNGDPSFLTWPMLRALEARGVEIGSHTVHHRDLTSLPTSGALAELRNARRALERQLGHPVPWLAYPFGRYDARIAQVARRAGYLLATTTRPGTRHSASAPLELRRLRVLDTTGVRGLAALLGQR